MLTFFMSGGIPMLFVTLFGIITLVAAIQFMRDPDEAKRDMLKAISRATGYLIVAGFCASLGSVMVKVAGNPEWANSPDLHLIIMTGIGESMSPPLLGCTLLSLAWLFVALGEKKLARLA